MTSFVIPSQVFFHGHLLCRGTRVVRVTQTGGGEDEREELQESQAGSVERLCPDPLSSLGGGRERSTALALPSEGRCVGLGRGPGEAHPCEREGHGEPPGSL